eukprot:gnl/TRDRNA2_/TRDRNA2_35533_c0_seq1.p1 gnl/TRDRNA2_/TRDRNA2_35533_c0~~gnl/TRDRNA2_/TRDRNA2_35533_c0_seq1.p1  ORF type:complete len:638 (-),score=181.67 gnl/TRDRNA2_/TRDRNA2_35533_c0_seq1:122-1819(-)
MPGFGQLGDLVQSIGNAVQDSKFAQQPDSDPSSYSAYEGHGETNVKMNSKTLSQLDNIRGNLAEAFAANKEKFRTTFDKDGKLSAALKDAGAKVQEAIGAEQEFMNVVDKDGNLTAMNMRIATRLAKHQKDGDMLAMMDEVGGLILENLPELKALSSKGDVVVGAIAKFAKEHPKEFALLKETSVQSVKDLIGNVTMYAVANPQQTEEFVVARAKDLWVNVSTFAKKDPQQYEKIKETAIGMVQSLPLNVKMLVNEHPEDFHAALQELKQGQTQLQEAMWEFAMEHPESMKEAMVYIVKGVQDLLKELTPGIKEFAQEHPEDGKQFSSILKQSGRSAAGNISSYLREHPADLQDLQSLDQQQIFTDKLYNFADAHPEAMKSVLQFILDQGQTVVDALDEWVTSNPDAAKEVQDYITDIRGGLDVELPNATNMLDSFIALQIKQFLDMIAKYSKENPEEMKAMLAVLNENIDKLSKKHPAEAKLISDTLLDSIPVEEAPAAETPAPTTEEPAPTTKRPAKTPAPTTTQAPEEPAEAPAAPKSDKSSADTKVLAFVALLACGLGGMF